VSICDSETAYSPEELVAMILNYTRIVAQDYAGVIRRGGGGGSIRTWTQGGKMCINKKEEGKNPL
jgi:hypothetical protein